MKTIEMSLDPKSISKAISELKKYRNDLQKKCARACRRLGQLGVISASFNTVVLAEGNTDFRILPLQGKEGSYRVVASGEDVAFVEFGAGEGVAYPAGYPVDGFADKVYAGSWSQEFDGMFARKGFWYYQRQKYYGTPAGMPMYQAAQDMRNSIVTIFKEEFS